MADFDAQAFLKTVSNHPGVYQMLGADQQVIYVGKAKNLKKRLSSYFVKTPDSIKTQRLVANIADIKTVITASEHEALLLENNLIKQHKPKYNILFRDDKTYPYILLSKHTFPRLSFYRGNRHKQGRFFGPFANSGAVKETLHFLQKVFKLRNCNDVFFKNRARPCLQYQIGRCSAPCVDYINEQDYQTSMQQAVAFLEGKSQTLLAQLAEKMQQAADALDYEKAADLRDQISSLRHIQQKQTMTSDSVDTDVIALSQQAEHACLQMMFIRQGKLLAERRFFPRLQQFDAEPNNILHAFITQYYFAKEQTQTPPKRIIISHQLNDIDALQTELKHYYDHKIEIISNPRAERRQWLQMAIDNATQALASRLASQSNLNKRFQALTKALALAAPPKRIECFDISHNLGEAPKASCVVFDREGPRKADYRCYNVKEVKAGDDYAAMDFALHKRYGKSTAADPNLPDLLLIDGGKGQVGQAIKVLSELGLTHITVLGIAKGPTRKAGLEILFFSAEGRGIQLAEHDPGLHLLQQVRDEAHRFAITGHRRQSQKQRQRSSLEEIPGIGPKRRQILLQTFGGLQEIMSASQDELARTPGIGEQIAQEIYAKLHGL